MWGWGEKGRKVWASGLLGASLGGPQIPPQPETARARALWVPEIWGQGPGGSREQGCHGWGAQGIHRSERASQVCCSTGRGLCLWD